MFYAIVRIPDDFVVPENAPFFIPYDGVRLPGTSTYYNEQLTICCAEDDADIAELGDVLCLQTADAAIIPLDKSANNFTKFWGVSVPPEECVPGIFAGIPWVTV